MCYRLLLLEVMTLSLAWRRDSSAGPLVPFLPLFLAHPPHF
jgi:hypothetical protein